ncbi:MAG: YceD family protein [Candidatus Binatia bacterium]
MKLAVDQITESPKDISFSERVEELNLIYKEEDKVRDYYFPPFLNVKLVYYGSGQEIFFQGWFGGTIEGRCSRCLKSYSFPIEKEFDFVLAPQPLSAKSKELSRDEMGLSFYAAEEINLSPLIMEQVLLALPIRPLCEDGCRGLCGGCGVNLNYEPCHCASEPGDPRMAIFRTLKLGR